MAYENPSIDQFKVYFTRDFPFGSDINTSITDTDIAKAFQMANMAINQRLWSDQAAYTIGYFLLSAHYLVMNLRASSQGINGQFNFLQANKSVAAVAEAFSIPQRILDNPELSILCKTNYGAQYLSLILPLLTGQMFAVYGRTQP